jgi:hypothetical protein
MTTDTHIETERKYAFIGTPPGNPKATCGVDHESVNNAKVTQAFTINFTSQPASNNLIVFIHQVEEFII